MDSRSTKWRTIARRVRSWFDLTNEERQFVLGVLALALIGLIARHLHAQKEKPDPYRPAGLPVAEQRSEP